MKTRVSLKYFVNDCRFNGVFSRDNLPRIEDGAYMINLNDKQSKGTHWVSLFIDKHMAVYLEFSGIEYIQREVLSEIQDKSITHDIFRTQDDDSIRSGFYFVAFIEYMLTGNLCLKTC